MNNPIKSQIAANRERFDEKCTESFAKGGFLTTDLVGDWALDKEPIKSFLTTSQTSLLQTAIDAVEGLKVFVPKAVDELGRPVEPSEVFDIAKKSGFNLGVLAVVELLKGGITD